jgi:hypothetical protein
MADNQVNSLMDLVQPAPPADPRMQAELDRLRAISAGGPDAMAAAGYPGGFNEFTQGAMQPGAGGYFDLGAGGNITPKTAPPEQTAGEAGVSLGQLAAGFGPSGNPSRIDYNIPSDRGGFFNAKDIWRGRSMPQIYTSESWLPSTNNWRLLGRGPGWIMRNNNLIDTRQARWGGPAGWVPTGGNTGEQSMGPIGSFVGSGAGYGVPNLLQAGLGQPVTYGWPGAAGGWHSAQGNA